MISDLEEHITELSQVANARMQELKIPKKALPVETVRIKIS